MKDVITDDTKVVAVKIQGTWEVFTRHNVDRDRFYRPEGFLVDVDRMRGYPTRILERYSDEYENKLVRSNVVEYSGGQIFYRWEYNASKEVWSCTTHPAVTSMGTKDMVEFLSRAVGLTSIRFFREVKDVHNR